MASGLLRNLAHVRQARSRFLRRCPRVAVRTLGRPPHRARGGHAHGSGGRQPNLANLCGLPACALLLALPVIRFIPRIFRIMDGRARRPSVSQAGHIPSWRGSCECYALSPVAVVSRWCLLLLSPLLSAAIRGTGGWRDQTVRLLREPIAAKARRDAVRCSVSCRQARHRFLRAVGYAESVTPGRPAASDTSYPSSKATHDAYAQLSWNLPRDPPHLSGDGPVPWPGSLPGPWFLARVLPEAQCQGWPKAISEGNAKRP